MSNASNTAVLIHGCHLQADLNGNKWEEIVWGIDAEGLPTLAGRATMGIQVAIEETAERIIFSTGASERDGIKEGEYTFRWALEHVAQLAGVLGVTENYLRGYLGAVHEIDSVSQNTAEECRLNFSRCASDGFDTVIIVSSPWHIERCHAEALKVMQSMRDMSLFTPRLLAQASYGSTEGIVILEPPHRGDRPKTRFHEFAPRFFRIPADEVDLFYQLLESGLTKLGA